MVTGTQSFTIGYTTNPLSEQVMVSNQMGVVPVVKLTNDSNVEVSPNPSAQAFPVTSSDQEYAAFGELLVAQVLPQTAWRFDYGINTRFVYTSGTMAGGQVSGSFSRAQLSTSTNVSGTAQIFSIKPLRYLPGVGGLMRMTAVFNTGTSNSEQLIGIADEGISDGFAFGYNGTSFGVVVIRAGVRTWIAQSQWNGSSLSTTLIPQYGNIYQIRFQWLGYGNINFMIFDSTLGKFVTVHTVHYPNTSPLTSILNPTLKLFSRIANLGNNTNIVMFTPSALGALEGHTESQFYNPLDVPNTMDSLKTFADANNNHLLTVRNKSTFLGVSNRVPVQINSIYFSRAGGAGTATNSTLRIYRNASTTGTLSFTDIDSLNSPVDTSVTTTIITSTNAEKSYAVSSNNPQIPIEFHPGELILNPGESISIGVQDSGVQSTECAVTANWDELF